MNLKLKSLWTWLPGLVLILLPALAGAADFDAPVAAQLTLRQGSGPLAVVWAAKPGVSVSNATLTLLITKDGGAQKRLLSRTLTLAQGQVSSLAVNLPLSGAGAYQVVALLRMGMAGGQYTKTSSLRFTLGSTGTATVVPEPLTTARQFAAQYRPTFPRRPALRAPAIERAATNMAGFTVRGQVFFTNVNFISAHTTQTVETWITTSSLPIRGAKVQICDLISSASFFYYQVLGTVYPDVNGRFSYYVNTNDDGDGTGRDIFLHLVADSGDCKVQDLGGEIFSLDMLPTVTLGSVKLLPLDWQGGDMNLDKICLDQPRSGPWNIIDAVQQGAQFVRARGAVAPKAVVRWERGNVDGTYFNPSTQMISLLGSAADSDEFDDGVILHEYGHMVAARNSVDKSSGGTHYMDQPANRTLAWSEGWATFFSCAARNSRFLIDSVNNAQAAGLSIDLETFSDIFTFDYRRGDDVEACVAASLWDIFDSASDYRDTLSDGMTHIWPIVTGYFNATRSCTFSDFYDGWRANAYPGLAQVQSILGVFGINYSGGLMVNSMLINNDGQMASSRTVKLNNLCSGSPTQYMASESPLFAGATWKTWSATPQFTLSTGKGYKRVFFKVRNAAGQESTAKFDCIELNEMRTLQVSGAPLAGTVPDVFSFDWYKLKIGTKDRYLVKSVCNQPLIVAVYKASDLSTPIFAGTTDINQIFPAGDYVVVVFQGDTGSGGTTTTNSYSIQVTPYHWVL